MIVNADALHLPIASGIVQTVVTSPPYFGLRDYGVSGQIGLEETPEEFIVNLVAVFREVRRVLRDDGTIWVNMGDSYCANGKGGRDTELRSRGKSIPRGNSRWGGGNNEVPGLKSKDLIGIPWMLAFALRADGWYLRSDIIWSKPNPMPESVTDRPTKAHEYLFLLSKSQRYYYDQDAVREGLTQSSIDRLSQDVENQTGSTRVPGKTNGNMKAVGGWRGSKFTSDYDKATKPGLGMGEREEAPGRNIRTVWTIATQPTSFAHFATFPEKLVEPCILAGSKAGDYVLDPFSGSGTVERVAIRHRRQFIGTELKFAYINEIARRRVDKIQIELGVGA